MMPVGGDAPALPLTHEHAGFRPAGSRKQASGDYKEKAGMAQKRGHRLSPQITDGKDGKNGDSNERHGDREAAMRQTEAPRAFKRGESRGQTHEDYAETALQ